MRELVWFLRLDEAIVANDREPGFLDVAPHAALLFGEVLHGSKPLDEGRGDATEERSVPREQQFNRAAPDGTRRTIFISSIGPRLLQVRRRMILGSDPSIVEWQEPDSNALASLDDGGFVDQMHAIGGGGAVQSCP